VISLPSGTSTAASGKEGLTYILSLVKDGNLPVAVLAVVMMIAFVLLGTTLSLGYHLYEGGYKSRGRPGASPVLSDVAAACEKAVGLAEKLEDGDGGGDGDNDWKGRPASAK
jgi:hypothetical protein